MRDLEFEYSPEDCVPDYAEHAERAARASDALRSALAPSQVRADAYASHPLAIAETFKPAGAGPHPAVIFVHGGYWKRASRPARAYLAGKWIAHGVAWVNIGYPIAPEEPLASIVAHAGKGIDWVLARAPELGLDPARIALCGNSAGGHLAAHYLANRASPAVRGAALVSGLFDLRPLERLAPHSWLRLESKAYSMLSPQTANAVPAVPLQVSVGALESDAFKEQSANYAAHVRARGGRAEYVEVPGVQHFSIAGCIGDPQSPIGRALCYFLGDLN